MKILKLALFLISRICSVWSQFFQTNFLPNNQKNFIHESHFDDKDVSGKFLWTSYEILSSSSISISL